VAQPTDPSIPIRIYGTEWCSDCHLARAYFEQRGIPYKWINPDVDPEAEAFVLRANQGLRSVPTIVFPDGSLLVEPSISLLARKLGSGHAD